MDAAADGPGRARWSLLALLPILVLVAIVGAVVAGGSRLTGLVGDNPPAADAFAVRRVSFHPSEIRIRVTNPQADALTIATVTVDDAIVPFALDGPRRLGRLESSTIVVPYDWVEGDPYGVGITSSTGIQTTHHVAAAVAARQPDARSWLGYAVIGLLVGVVPVALGLGWLPSLRRASRRWTSAFMALTAGLLSFLAVDALAEALALAAVLPAAFGGVGILVLGVAISFLGLTWVSRRFSGAGGRAGGALDGGALALLVATGIGLHNLGEGLAIGSSFALGELALGSFLIVGFMLHNLTEGLGIATPIAAAGERVRPGRLVFLALVAGVPAVVGGWIGGFLTSDLLGVLFFAVAVGAALQVVLEVGRYIARHAPGGLTSGHAIGGFVAGIAAMYATGLLLG